jgi:polysaccharide chain length determinant protein (PEP-CTERM system associated)
MNGMDDFLKPLMVVLAGMWDRRWVGIGVAWAVALIGGIALVFMPDRYEASATVFVDTQSVLKPLMNGLAVQPDINQQVAMIAKTLISRPNIEHVLDSPDVAFTDKRPGARDAEVDHLMKDIKIDIDGREGLYSIKYRDKDPERARNMVQGLITLFVQSGIGNKEKDSAEAQKFIDDQIAIYEKKLSDAEKRLKDFKVRNLGYTGQNTADYYQRVSQLSEELTNLRGQLHAAEQGRDALHRELAGEEPTLLPDPGSPKPMSETDTRLEAARKHLDELLGRFTEQHPDVVATRHLIAQLEHERQSEVTALRNGTGRDGMRYSMATNPIFQKLRLELADAEANVASLQARVSDVQARLSELRSAASKVPLLDEEFAQLNRDYDVIRKNYDQLVTRRESASMSQNVNATNQLADFRVTEPPRVAPRPVFPNHLVLIPLLLIVALGAGLAAALQLSRAMPTFQSLKSLREAIPRPVLGSVSLQMTPDQAAREHRQNIIFVASVVGLVAVDIAWTGWTLLNQTVV